MNQHVSSLLQKEAAPVKVNTYHVAVQFTTIGSKFADCLYLVVARPWVWMATTTPLMKIFGQSEKWRRSDPFSIARIRRYRWLNVKLVILFLFSNVSFCLTVLFFSSRVYTRAPGWCTVKIRKEKEIFQVFEPTITEKGSCNLHPSNESLNSFEYLIGDKTAANAKWFFFGVCREGRWFLRRRLIHVILWQASVAAAPRYSETRSSWLLGDFHGQIIRYHGKWSMREMFQNEKSLISRVDAWCLNGKKLHLWFNAAMFEESPTIWKDEWRLLFERIIFVDSLLSLKKPNECHRVIMKGQDCCWRKVLNMCVCKVEFVKGC